MSLRGGMLILLMLTQILSMIFCWLQTISALRFCLANLHRKLQT
ncbi:hypothetical protein NC651_028789 [Populus alba x Populus x berolinensis]|nr:hypothetical protein NC651_028789 [Populus alba x Populus x berolinensis]